MDCNHSFRLSAFYDGELPASATRDVELHLQTCPDCRNELAALREVSAAFSAVASTERLSPLGRARAHEAADTASDELSRNGSGEALVRLAFVLSGMAASILVVAGAWLFVAPSTEPPIVASMSKPSADWERVAMTFEPDRIEVDPAAADSRIMLADACLSDARVADWMMRNLER